MTHAAPDPALLDGLPDELRELPFGSPEFKAENARIAVRNVRHHGMDDLKRHKDGMSDDDLAFSFLMTYDDALASL